MQKISENSSKSSKIFSKIHDMQMAQKIINSLSNLQNNIELNQRRWIWELISNAKSASINSKIEINIVLHKNSLDFSHNGRPFTEEDLICLIEQYSSKDLKNEDNFMKHPGLGFIATNLLSKKVRINSIWQGKKQGEEIYKKFEFELDRDSDSLNSMLGKLEEAFEILDELKNIEDFNPKNEYKTTFHYDLDEKGKKVAEIGLKELEYSGLLVLLFNKEICWIKVKDKINNIKKKYYKPKNSVFSYKEQGITLETSEITENKIRKKEYHHLKIQGNEIDIALELIFNENSQKYEIAEKNFQTPRVFINFPLIGNEEFIFPCFVNSSLFCPNEQKDQLILKGSSNETKRNKRLFANMKPQIKDLMAFICEMREKNDKNYFSKRHLLALTKLPKNSDEEWYKTKIQKSLRRKLFNIPIIENNFSEYLKISDCIIILADSKYLIDFYDLLMPIYDKSLIKKNEKYILFWLDQIDSNWQKSLKETKNLYDIHNLLELIHTNKELKNLRKQYTFNSESDVLLWLNKVLLFLMVTVTQEEKDKLLNTYAILPNQVGKFMKLNELSEDFKIPENMKDICLILGHDIRSKLLELNINIRVKEVLDSNSLEKIIEKYYYDEFVLDTNINLLRASIEILVTSAREKNNNFKNDLDLKTIEIIQAFFLDFKIIVKKKKELPYHLCKKAEFYIFKEILNRIEKSKNLNGLAQYLYKDEGNTFNILKNFYLIFCKRKKINIFANRKVFLNQIKEFQTYNDLMIDKIEQNLKDTIEEGVFLKKPIEVISFELKKIYTKIIKEEKHSLESKLLDNSLKTNFYKIIKKEFTLKDISQKMEEGFTHNLIKQEELINLKEILLNLDKIKREYFSWIDINCISEIHGKKFNVLNIAPISFEESRSFLKSKNNMNDNPIVNYNKNKNESSVFWNDNLNNIAKQKDKLNAPTNHQFQEMILTKEIKISPILGTLEAAKKNIFEILSKNEGIYNLFEAFYDQNAPNQNILLKVKKNNIFINIVVRPFVDNKIIIHNEREIKELENPKNELWCSNGNHAIQISLGIILKKSKLKMIKI